MIDNRYQVARLLSKLEGALPISATLTPRLAAVLQDNRPRLDITQECRIVRVDYAGDAGGIMCCFALGEDGAEQTYVVSITQLAFRRTDPLAREIAAYQKRRLKRIRIVDAYLPSRGRLTLMRHSAA